MAKVNWKPVFLILPKKNPTTGKDYWFRIGTAFENHDGSWNVDLHVLPFAEGKIQIRNQDNKYPDRKPHPFDPAESDPFDTPPLPPLPVMQ
jgi:hypothetical protein